MTGPVAEPPTAGGRRRPGDGPGTGGRATGGTGSRSGYADAGERPVIRAAGGVVWRPAAGQVEVCLVHRPRYDDWSLPKGKLEPAEHPLVAAVREVAEETGWTAVPQVRLPSVRYHSSGVPKTVDYWSMRADPDRPAAPGGAEPEVDLVRWFPLSRAVDVVSYPHDAMVLRAFAGLPPVTAVLGLVRHGWAGQRGTWSGPDTARPLDPRGWAQAHALAAPLARLRPRELRTASARRCVQTLGPLAGSLDLPIRIDGRLDETGPGQDADERALAMVACLVELADAGGQAVLCGQGGVIPGALRILTSAGGSTADTAAGGTADTAAGGTADTAGDLTTERGAGWLLAFGAGGSVTATRI